MAFPYEEFDLTGIETYPLAGRQSKVRIEHCAKPVGVGATVTDFFASLPAVLGAADLRRVIAALIAARRREGGIIWGIGAHVIKSGVSPIVIDLMRRGYVSALSMNGAGMIHDF